MSLAPRIVVVHRRTELDELLARHGTRGQAQFFLGSRGRSLEEVDARHAAVRAALATATAAIPIDWRRADVERADLDRFLFTQDDVVAVVGQDGLVANVAKYLDGQPVIGVDPEPGRNAGVLVSHAPEAFEPCSTTVAAGTADVRDANDGRSVARRRADSRRAQRDLRRPSKPSVGALQAASRTAPKSGSRLRVSSSRPARVRRAGAGRSGSSPTRRSNSLSPPSDDSSGSSVKHGPRPRRARRSSRATLEPDHVLRVVAETDGLVVFGDGSSPTA